MVTAGGIKSDLEDLAVKLRAAEPKGVSGCALGVIATEKHRKRMAWGT